VWYELYVARLSQEESRLSTYQCQNLPHARDLEKITTSLITVCSYRSLPELVWTNNGIASFLRPQYSSSPVYLDYWLRPHISRDRNDRNVQASYISPVSRDRRLRYYPRPLHRTGRLRAFSLQEAHPTSGFVDRRRFDRHTHQNPLPSLSLARWPQRQCRGSVAVSFMIPSSWFRFLSTAEAPDRNQTRNVSYPILRDSWQTFFLTLLKILRTRRGTFRVQCPRGSNLPNSN